MAKNCIAGKPGIKAKDVHEQVSKYIDSTNFKGRFIHSTGHSLGLAVHDPGGGLNVTCELELKENMVFTVEPGVYIPGFGGVRVEDDVLVTKDGVEILTKFPKELSTAKSGTETEPDKVEFIISTMDAETFMLPPCNKKAYR